MSWQARLRPAAPTLNSAARYRTAPAATVPRATALVLELGRAITRYRRPLAAFCAALAVVTGLSAITAKPAPGAEVVTAARDLPAGTTLSSNDLQTVTLPARALPGGAITSTPLAVGHTVTSAVRRGEPLTDVRLAGGPLGTPAPGMVATPVRLADAEAAELLQPGQRVDVLAASTSTAMAASVPAQPETSEMAALVATDVRVVAVPASRAAPGSAASAQDLGLEGALVVLSTTPAQARMLAQAQVTTRLSVVVVG